MEGDLLHNVKAILSKEVISKLSANLGESEQNILKGIDLTIPSILLALQNKNEEGLKIILTASRQLFNTVDLQQAFNNYFGSPAGTDMSKFETQNLLASIFGGKLNAVVHPISNYINMRPESVQGLLGVCLPAVISSITHKGTDWNIKTIELLLRANKSSFTSALPRQLVF